MNRTLTQNINRGREAIDLARHQGHDTAQWELSLAELERQEMLAWASELADQKLILATEICFAETPLRPITITEVSKYAVAHLMFIAKSILEQQAGGWHIWTSEWWTQQEHAALDSLSALRKAMEISGT